MKSIFTHLILNTITDPTLPSLSSLLFSSSLVSDTSIVQQSAFLNESLGPDGLPLGGFNQINVSQSSLERDMDFYKFFDTSGPSLVTVNASLTNVIKKAEVLSTTIDTNMSTVNIVGVELKTLSSAIACKAEASQLSALQDEVKELNTDVATNTTQLQFLNGHVNRFTGEVKTLSAKIDTLNQLLAEILAKMREPTPVPESSFTDNDRLSLTLAADFIFEATSLISDLEECLKGLEVDVRKSPVSDPDAADKIASPDNNKEGEKILLKKMQRSPQRKKRRKEDEEELDIEDQGSKDDVTDDDDEEEDQSLWFTLASIRTPVPAMKGVEIKEAGERQDKPLYSSTHGKQKGIFVEGNLKLLSTSVGELPSQTDDEDEEEESLIHPRRPSRPLQRAERLIVECQEDASLALKVQSTLVKEKKLKKNPVKVQATLLKEIKETNRKAKEISDSELAWCRNKHLHRSHTSMISVMTITGTRRDNQQTITMEIFRRDGTAKAMFFSKLETFGFYEWLDFKEALKKSKSKFRGNVEELINALINRVTTRMNIPSALPQKPRSSRKKNESLSDNDVVIRNETSIKFSREAVVGPPPDLSVLDLSLPHGKSLRPGKVINEPLRIFFRDNEENISRRLRQPSPVSLIETTPLTATSTVSIPPIATSTADRLQIESHHHQIYFSAATRSRAAV
ncbi:hypothetical protein L6452_39006 [Arctium lappa]|uniref:Uncharacterized protein n=1 Tax=Arctium lappa TaxID=4217 RepID=A0ACB8XS03_ARCLA|nr:hypothetical protein L6452_39006 [Arctium lappa]